MKKGREGKGREGKGREGRGKVSVWCGVEGAAYGALPYA